MKNFTSLLFYVSLLISLPLTRLIAQENSSAGPVPNNIKAERYADYSGRTNNNAFIAYAHSSIQNLTVSLPIPAGTPLTSLASFTPPNFASSMQMGPEGNLYITEISPALYLMNPGTGVVTLLGSITGMVGGDLPNGISYNLADHTFYICSNTNLYSFNVSTRVATFIGPFNTGTSGIMIDLCFDASGICYAYDNATDNAYIINTANGNATLLGPIGFDANFGQGMSYDYETSTIYLSAFNNSTFTGQLRTMDPNTGMTSLIVDWGFEQLAPFTVGTELPICPVGYPTDPNPPTGATDIPIIGNTLSWTNGSGTVYNEVWFNGNMVYDGPAITSYSLAPQEPLDYNTTYYWRIICKDDICPTYGFTWTFKTRLDSNLINAFYDDFESGTSNWTITNDGGTCIWQTILLSSRPYTMPQFASGNGLVADADLCGSGSTLLSTATINQTFDFSSNFNIYIEFDSDWRTISAVDEAHVEVSTNGGSTWTAIWSYVGESRRNTHEMVSASILDGQTNCKIRLRSVQPGWDWWWAVDNFVVYYGCLSCYPPAKPTNLTAEATNFEQVTLNWQDNSWNEYSFLIERKDGDSLSANQFSQIASTLVNATSFIDSTVIDSSVYTYRVRAHNQFGNSAYSNLAQVLAWVNITSAENEKPAEFSLSQNYPNPFNPTTSIQYTISSRQFVTLKVYDLLGREVATLVNEEKPAGEFEVEFDVGTSRDLSLPSGIYFYQLKAGNFVDTKKMIILK